MLKIKNKGYFWWLIIIIFFIFQSVSRVFPNIIIDEILIKFKINASEFSTLGSIYLYLYAIMQIPVGILADKYGMRVILIPSVILCLIANYLFITTDSFLILKISRGLLSIGSACAFPYSLKVCVDYLPPEKRGMFVGITSAISYSSCIILADYFPNIVEKIGWQDLLFITSLMGLIGLILIILEFPIHVKDPEYIKRSVFDFGKSVFDRNIILYSIITIGLYSPIGVFADLWSTGFLAAKYGIENVIATSKISWIYIGAVIGSFIIPIICVKKIKLSITFGQLALLCFFSYMIYGNNLYLIPFIFFNIGILTGVEGLCFIGAVVGSTRNNSGFLLAFITALDMFGNGVLQQLVGYFMPIVTLNGTGIKSYTGGDFSVAFSAVVVTMIICFLLSLKIKE